MDFLNFQKFFFSFRSLPYFTKPKCRVKVNDAFVRIVLHENNSQYKYNKIKFLKFPFR